MTALGLKVLGLIAMISDHAAMYMKYAGILSGESFIFSLMRAFGRIAFPIFGFLIVEGIRHTKSVPKYLLRLFVAAVLSEFFWDAFLQLRWIDWEKQNVLFTLLLGACVLALFQWIKKLPKEKKIWGILITVLFYLGTRLLEEFFYTDYGNVGVMMIVLMGLLLFPMEKIRNYLVNENMTQTAFSLLGIGAMVVVSGNYLELYGLFSLIPIFLYNGLPGKKSKAIQYGFYVFYPLQFLVFYMIFIFPKFGMSVIQ